ncbi:T9SS type A sorting domain-containing protein [Hymenobacter convexus]|uniref:T9SS type A sorting domain-containing protein n=1 Tax=Hymenobacter sp. CA1UV-4 TaxID=3063782 RepID=UPI002713CBDB|nr:T9SS type A sorting domain-containing protein [Hymenobacter sp. CA1UV-4]MDO7854335.1 T9SS type A sorting domain-containing protein [Hymenobacter sp. CA1UV-4]
MKTAILFLCGLLFFSAAAQAQSATYYWQGANGTSANWATAASWNTVPTGGGLTRLTQLDSDILIIQGGTTASPKIVSVNFGSSGTTSSQSIGRLILRGNVELHVPTANNAATFKNITITGRALLTGTSFDETTTAIDDLVAESGSTVKVIGDGANGNNNTRSNLNFLMGTNTGPFPNATANIAGALTFTNASSSNGNGLVTHTFQGATAGTVRFVSGGSLSIVYAGSGDAYTGASFSGATGLAVFESGATLNQEVASDNYGPVSFLAGSTFQYRGGSFGPLTTDRTYGNLEFAGGTATASGAQTLTVLNDLTMTAGVFNDNLTGGSTGTGTVLQGNLLANGGTLNFTPSGGAGRVGFNGSSLQTISGAGTLNFGVNAHVQMNNSAGLTLQRSAQVNGLLILTTGIINTTSTALLTLGAGVDAQGGSSASYVNGPVAHITSAGTNSNIIFPVGKSGNYRPLFLNTTGQSAAATYVGEQIETAPNQTLTAPLTRVSFRRYFQLAPTAAVTLTNATVTITFGVDDFVNYPADPTFVMAIRNAANTWSSIGNSASTGTATNGAPVAGSLTSAPFTSFPTTTSGFSLASTSTATGYPGVNPLPVELTKFTATTKASGIVLDWATASEKNSAVFEVQRSADGESFQTIAKVAAQGNSVVAHSYTALDRTPLAGVSQYRLRQLDADGTVAYSPVVTARWAVGGEASVYPNPTKSTLFFGSLAAPAKFRVLNGQGQALLIGTTSAAGLDVQPLPAGIYLLEIVTESGRSVQRFVRE